MVKNEQSTQEKTLGKNNSYSFSSYNARRSNDRLYNSTVCV